MKQSTRYTAQYQNHMFMFTPPSTQRLAAASPHHRQGHGNITTRPGNITARPGNITARPGNITARLGNITARLGNITAPW